VTAYSKHEREFTFAKIKDALFTMCVDFARTQEKDNTMKIRTVIMRKVL